MEQQNWTAVYERRDNGWFAYCAEVPGCDVIRGTLAEARLDLKNVVLEMLEKQKAEASANAGRELEFVGA